MPKDKLAQPETSEPVAEAEPTTNLLHFEEPIADEAADTDLLKPAGPRAKRVEIWLDIPEESAYPGYRFRAWINHPSKLFSTLQADAAKSLSSVFLEHNGWIDTEGEPYPPMSDPDFWGEIPDDLMRAMMATLDKEKDVLPNLVRRMPRR